MTAPQHTDAEPVVEEPAVSAPEPVSDRETNLRRLRERAEKAEAERSAYQQVLAAIGIEVSEDGALNQEQIREWGDRQSANNERARNDLLREAGFDPDSAEGMVLVDRIDRGEIVADADSVKAFADEKGWTPNAGVYLMPHQIEGLAASRRRDHLSQVTHSDSKGDPLSEGEHQIAEARDRGDYHTASILQDQLQKKGRR